MSATLSSVDLRICLPSSSSPPNSSKKRPKSGIVRKDDLAIMTPPSSPSSNTTFLARIRRQLTNSASPSNKHASLPASAASSAGPALLPPLPPSDDFFHMEHDPRRGSLPSSATQRSVTTAKQQPFLTQLPAPAPLPVPSAPAQPKPKHPPPFPRPARMPIYDHPYAHQSLPAQPPDQDLSDSFFGYGKSANINSDTPTTASPSESFFEYGRDVNAIANTDSPPTIILKHKHLVSFVPSLVSSLDSEGEVEPVPNSDAAGTKSLLVLEKLHDQSSTPIPKANIFPVISTKSVVSNSSSSPTIPSPSTKILPSTSDSDTPAIFRSNEIRTSRVSISSSAKSSAPTIVPPFRKSNRFSLPSTKSVVSKSSGSPTVPSTKIPEADALLSDSDAASAISKHKHLVSFVPSLVSSLDSEGETEPAPLLSDSDAIFGSNKTGTSSAPILEKLHTQSDNTSSTPTVVPPILNVNLPSTKSNSSNSPTIPTKIAPSTAILLPLPGKVEAAALLSDSDTALGANETGTSSASISSPAKISTPVVSKSSSSPTFPSTKIPEAAALLSDSDAIFGSNQTGTSSAPILEKVHAQSSTLTVVLNANLPSTKYNSSNSPTIPSPTTKILSSTPTLHPSPSPSPITPPKSPGHTAALPSIDSHTSAETHQTTESYDSLESKYSVGSGSTSLEEDGDGTASFVSAEAFFEGQHEGGDEQVWDPCSGSTVGSLKDEGETSATQRRAKIKGKEKEDPVSTPIVKKPRSRSSSSSSTTSTSTSRGRRSARRVAKQQHHRQSYHRRSFEKVEDYPSVYSFEAGSVPQRENEQARTEQQPQTETETESFIGSSGLYYAEQQRELERQLDVQLALKRELEVEVERRLDELLRVSGKELSGEEEEKEKELPPLPPADMRSTKISLTQQHLDPRLALVHPPPRRDSLPNLRSSSQPLAVADPQVEIKQPEVDVEEAKNTTFMPYLPLVIQHEKMMQLRIIERKERERENREKEERNKERLRVVKGNASSRLGSGRTASAVSLNGQAANAKKMTTTASSIMNLRKSKSSIAPSGGLNDNTFLGASSSKTHDRYSQPEVVIPASSLPDLGAYAAYEDAQAYTTDSDPDSEASSHVSPITPHLYSSAAGFFGVDEGGRGAARRASKSKLRNTGSIDVLPSTTTLVRSNSPVVLASTPPPMAPLPPTLPHQNHDSSPSSPPRPRRDSQSSPTRTINTSTSNITLNINNISSALNLNSSAHAQAQGQQGREKRNVHRSRSRQGIMRPLSPPPNVPLPLPPTGATGTGTAQSANFLSSSGVISSSSPSPPPYCGPAPLTNPVSKRSRKRSSRSIVRNDTSASASDSLSQSQSSLSYLNAASTEEREARQKSLTTTAMPPSTPEREPLLHRHPTPIFGEKQGGDADGEVSSEARSHHRQLFVSGRDMSGSGSGSGSGSVSAPPPPLTSLSGHAFVASQSGSGSGEASSSGEMYNHWEENYKQGKKKVQVQVQAEGNVSKQRKEYVDIEGPLESGDDDEEEDNTSLVFAPPSPSPLPRHPNLFSHPHLSSSPVHSELPSYKYIHTPQQASQDSYKLAQLVAANTWYNANVNSSPDSNTNAASSSTAKGQQGGGGGGGGSVLAVASRRSSPESTIDLGVARQILPGSGIGAKSRKKRRTTPGTSMSTNMEESRQIASAPEDAEWILGLGASEKKYKSSSRAFLNLPFAQQALSMAAAAKEKEKEKEKAKSKDLGLSESTSSFVSDLTAKLQDLETQKKMQTPAHPDVPSIIVHRETGSVSTANHEQGQFVSSIPMPLVGGRGRSKSESRTGYASLDEFSRLSHDQTWIQRPSQWQSSMRIKGEKQTLGHRQRKESAVPDLATQPNQDWTLSLPLPTPRRDWARRSLGVGLFGGSQVVVGNRSSSAPVGVSKVEKEEDRLDDVFKDDERRVVDTKGDVDGDDVAGDVYVETQNDDDVGLELQSSLAKPSSTAIGKGEREEITPPADPLQFVVDEGIPIDESYGAYDDGDEDLDNQIRRNLRMAARPRVESIVLCVPRVVSSGRGIETTFVEEQTVERNLGSLDLERESLRLGSRKSNLKADQKQQESYPDSDSDGEVEADVLEDENENLLSTGSPKASSSAANLAKLDELSADLERFNEMLRMHKQRRRGPGRRRYEEYEGMLHMNGGSGGGGIESGDSFARTRKTSGRSFVRGDLGVEEVPSSYGAEVSSGSSSSSGGGAGDSAAKLKLKPKLKTRSSRSMRTLTQRSVLEVDEHPPPKNAILRVPSVELFEVEHDDDDNDQELEDDGADCSRKTLNDEEIKVEASDIAMLSNAKSSKNIAANNQISVPPPTPTNSRLRPLKLCIKLVPPSSPATMVVQEQVEEDLEEEDEDESALPTPLASSFPVPPVTVPQGLLSVGQVKVTSDILQVGNVNRRPSLESRSSDRTIRLAPSPAPSPNSNAVDGKASSTSKHRLATDSVILEGGIVEEDNESMFSGSFYSARSSFSSEVRH